MDLILINSSLFVAYCLWWFKILRTTRYSQTNHDMVTLPISANSSKRYPYDQQSHSPASTPPSNTVTNPYIFTGCSIVVPFRNEETRITPILDSLIPIKASCPWEVIFINDHSNDNTVEIISRWINQNQTITARLIHSPYSGKKEALKAAISVAEHPWILTTDADCQLPSTILESHRQVSTIHPMVQCIIGRVEFTAADDPIPLQTHYELLENQVLVAIGLSAVVKTSLGSNHSGSAPIAANGANLCFHKDSWLTLGGIDAHRTIASGDDIFTAEMFFQQNSTSVKINNDKNGVVKAQLCNSLLQLIHQRLRWFKKSFLQKSQKTLFQQLFFGVYLIALWGLSGIAVYRGYVVFAFLPISAKAIADTYFGNKLLRYHQYSFTWQLLPAASVLQTLFLPILAISSPFVSYSWKNRSHNI